MKLIKNKWNKKDLGKILLEDKGLEAGLVENANQVMNAIKDIYKDESGQSFAWEVKVFPRNRKSRMYVAVICDNPAIRNKEAKHGLIAKKMNSMKTSAKVRL